VTPVGYLILAILLEVSGTLCMKASDGFTRPLATAGMVLFYTLCFAALTLAVKRIDISVAYAIWSGVGTALIAVAGALLFRELMTPLKILSLLLIIAGVIGLRLSGAGH
jgi:small multidrug resistance pump